jgi:hypothetical protein
MGAPAPPPIRLACLQRSSLALAALWRSLTPSLCHRAALDSPQTPSATMLLAPSPTPLRGLNAHAPQASRVAGVWRRAAARGGVAAGACGVGLRRATIRDPQQRAGVTVHATAAGGSRAEGGSLKCAPAARLSALHQPNRCSDALDATSYATKRSYASRCDWTRNSDADDGWWEMAVRMPSGARTRGCRARTARARQCWRTPGAHPSEFQGPYPKPYTWELRSVAGGEQQRRRPTGRERTSSPTLQTLQDPILLRPWGCFQGGGY